MQHLCNIRAKKIQMYMYIYIYVYTYIHIPVCMRAYMICMCIYTEMCIYINIYMETVHICMFNDLPSDRIDLIRALLQTGTKTLGNLALYSRVPVPKSTYSISQLLSWHLGPYTIIVGKYYTYPGPIIVGKIGPTGFERRLPSSNLSLPPNIL